MSGEKIIFASPYRIGRAMHQAEQLAQYVKDRVGVTLVVVPTKDLSELRNKVARLEKHLDTFCKCPSHNPSLVQGFSIDEVPE